MDRYSGQSGRIGCGTSVWARSTAASTALVPFGRRTAAVTLRVATSTAIVSSGRRAWPSSHTTITSSRVLSIITSSPGSVATVGVNTGSGRDARRRWPAAVNASCSCSATERTSRLNVATGGTATAPGP